MQRRSTFPRSTALALLIIAFCLEAAAGGTAAWDGEAWADYSPYIAIISPEVERRVRAIAERGAALGRTPGRLGQYGDSISESYAFMRNVLAQGIALNETGHDYAPVITWLREAYADASREEGRLGDHFGKGPAYGNRGGWTIEDLFAHEQPERAADLGEDGEPGNFAWAIVMLGSNDLHRPGWNPMAWRLRLRALLLDVADLGIVPVLSTIPPRADHLDDDRVEDANFHIRALARQLSLPLVDYFDAIVTTRPDDWHGTLLSADGVHPSAGGGGRDFSRQALEFTDGYAMRSKLVLDMAERLRPLLSAAYGAGG